MTRRADLIAASDKSEAAVKRLLAVKKRNPAQNDALLKDYASWAKQLKELATLPPDAPGNIPPVEPPVVTPPVVPGDAATKSRAWNRLEAADNIKAVYERSGLGDTATHAERRAALGDGLFAQAIGLGQFGSPYWGPGDADTDLSPEEFAVGDVAGGYWGRRSGLDNKLTPGFYQRIFAGSKLVAEKLTGAPMSYEDAHALALANGLNDAEDGPA